MKKNRTVLRSYPEGLTLDRLDMPDEWPLRRWDWPISDGEAPKGSLIFQTGRGDFFEKYLESLMAWHQAGWNLTGFDWRGQSGSGRLLNDPTVGHAESFEPWIADLDRFVADWRQRMPGPHILASHSMGGHIAMRYLVDHRPKLDGAIFSAPMLKVVSKPLGDRLSAFVARQFARFGFAEQHAWQENEKPSLPGSSRQKLLTHDDDRYADEGWWLANKPELKMGPPSWQWLVAAYESSARMFAPGGLEAVETPVLILAAQKDRLVSIGAIREAAARLPDCRLYVHPEAAHEVFRERDEIRDPLMAEVAAFLEGCAAARP
ncbi:alpha/beta hydrolase [Parasphingopyxis sp. GrpM-11]|uniref:Alpha/beta hydrolase n=1 Tax=Parasphingopyxis marina TaxID=2761622 RepID=A0A842HWY3_9SPHN|nr:alpha/beta hydrolase [Parasphingopyxis marina]